MWAVLLKIFGISVGCFFKPVIAIPAAAAAGAEFYQTFIGGVLGGCSGIITFFYGLDFLIETYRKYFQIKNKKNALIHSESKKKPIFTRRNRMIVNMMQRYGLNGITLIIPLLSIPLGAFVAERINDKFIQNRKKVLIYLCSSMVIWSFILSFVSQWL